MERISSTQTPSETSFKYDNADPTNAHPWLMPALDRIVDALQLPPDRRRLFDVGCGNGSAGEHWHQRGFAVTGVDPSPFGIRQANAAYPHLNLAVGSSDDDLAAIYGRFPLVTSLDVIEHVPLSFPYAARLFDLLEPGGHVLLSTPYSGYLKNLLISLLDKWDHHLDPLWDYGHVKMFSCVRLRQLLERTGFVEARFFFAGAVWPVSKSLIALARKPEAPATPPAPR